MQVSTNSIQKKYMALKKQKKSQLTIPDLFGGEEKKNIS